LEGEAGDFTRTSGSEGLDLKDATEVRKVKKLRPISRGLNLIEDSAALSDERLKTHNNL
jgi:hypothetical protein